MCYKLYRLKQYQYLEHPILSVVLNIGTKQRSPVATSYLVSWINCVSQTSLVINCGNVAYKTQKPLNESSSLKSFSFIER